MKIRGLFTVVALTFAAAACNDSGVVDGEPEATEPEQIGTLALNLVGADSDGRQYRLRGAEFHIQSFYFEPFPIPPADGGVSSFDTTVSSEDNLDTARISLTVIPGQYNIELTSPDWYLERNTEGTWERVEQAVLLSPVYQYAFVYDKGVSAVNYRFGVDGELIDFRSGELSIGIEIEQPGEGAPDAGFPGGIIGGFGGLFGGGIVGGIAGGIAGGAIAGGGIDAGVGAPP